MGLLRPLCLLLLLLVGITGPAARAQEAGPRADPSINAPYRDPDFQSWVEIFEQPGREVYDRREAIVEALGVKTGMEVADIGAGTGLFTLLFAREVGPSGRVYAVDISEIFVKNIKRRARSLGLGNVDGIVNDQRSAKLSPNGIDLAFISDTYHHFEYPQQMMASIREALRPGGALVVIDFRKEGATGWVSHHVRASREGVITEIESFGFEFVEDVPLLQRNYVLRFRKPRMQ